MEDHETVLVITQRDATTTLQPLPTAPSMQLSVVTVMPGPPGPPGTAGTPGDGSTETYDPGDLTLWFENGLV